MYIALHASNKIIQREHFAWFAVYILSFYFAIDRDIKAINKLLSGINEFGYNFVSIAGISLCVISISMYLILLIISYKKRTESK